MMVLCCRKDVKTLGKVGEAISGEHSSVELPIVKGNEKEKDSVNVIALNNQSSSSSTTTTTTNDESPTKLDDEQPTSIEMTMVEKVEGNGNEVTF